jgi:hypothetical protein
MHIKKMFVFKKKKKRKRKEGRKGRRERGREEGREGGREGGRGWRVGSVVKNTDYSSRGPEFNSHNHMVAHNHLYWDPMPSSGVSEDSYNVFTYNK